MKSIALKNNCSKKVSVYVPVKERNNMEGAARKGLVKVTQTGNEVEEKDKNIIKI